MDIKNKIKIDSFEITRMYLADIPEVLKMAVLAQGSFRISAASSPTVFLSEISENLQKNTRFSFVFRSKDKIFAAFIVKPQTSKSAELLYAFSDPRAIQTEKLYDAFLEKLESMQFEIFYVRVLKKRKKFEAYVRFLNLFGFKKVFNENDAHLILVKEKS